MNQVNEDGTPRFKDVAAFRRFDNRKQFWTSPRAFPFETNKRVPTLFAVGRFE